MSGRMSKPLSFAGIHSGLQVAHSIVTRSPELMVSAGLMAGVEIAPMNRVGRRPKQAWWSRFGRGAHIHGTSSTPGMIPGSMLKQYFAISPARVNQIWSAFLCWTQCLIA